MRSSSGPTCVERRASFYILFFAAFFAAAFLGAAFFCATFFAGAFLAALFWDAADLGAAFCAVFAGGTAFLAEADFFDGAVLLIEEAVLLAALFAGVASPRFVAADFLATFFSVAGFFTGSSPAFGIVACSARPPLSVRPGSLASSAWAAGGPDGLDSMVPASSMSWPSSPCSPLSESTSTCSSSYTSWVKSHMLHVV